MSIIVNWVGLGGRYRRYAGDRRRSVSGRGENEGYFSCCSSYSPSVCAIQSKSGKKLSIIADWDSGRGEDGGKCVGEGASPQTMLFGAEVQTEHIRALAELW